MKRTLTLATLVSLVVGTPLNAQQLQVGDRASLDRARAEAQQLNGVEVALLRTRVMLAYLIRLHLEKTIYTQQIAGIDDESSAGKTFIIGGAASLAEALVAGVGIGAVKGTLNYFDRPDVRAFNAEFDKTTKALADAKKVLRVQGKLSSPDVAAIEAAAATIKQSQESIAEMLTRKATINKGLYTKGINFGKRSIAGLGILVTVDQITYQMEVSIVNYSTLQEFKKNLDQFIDQSQETINAYNQLN